MKIPIIFYIFVVASILIELMLSFSMRPGFSLLGEKRRVPPQQAKNLLIPSPSGKSSPSRLPPHQIFIPPTKEQF